MLRSTQTKAATIGLYGAYVSWLVWWEFTRFLAFSERYRDTPGVLHDSSLFDHIACGVGIMIMHLIFVRSQLWLQEATNLSDGVSMKQLLSFAAFIGTIMMLALGLAFSQAIEVLYGDFNIFIWCPLRVLFAMYCAAVFGQMVQMLELKNFL